ERDRGPRQQVRPLPGPEGRLQVEAARPRRPDAGRIRPRAPPEGLLRGRDAGGHGRPPGRRGPRHDRRV
ncbi:MAG: hypothetical protein AVDCRST_MAG01-01-4487, partial [uncultured Rubrobacteraceae bacterium]